jgi:hypothetical protein
MGVKRPRALALYHSMPALPPDAALDARILAAARHVAPARRRGPALLAAALAATLLIAFTVRWFAPGADSKEIDTRNFGIAEGQARVWLASANINTQGPGSREGLP